MLLFFLETVYEWQINLNGNKWKEFINGEFSLLKSFYLFSKNHFNSNIKAINQLTETIKKTFLSKEYIALMLTSPNIISFLRLQSVISFIQFHERRDRCKGKFFLILKYILAPDKLDSGNMHSLNAVFLANGSGESKHFISSISYLPSFFPNGSSYWTPTQYPGWNSVKPNKKKIKRV